MINNKKAWGPSTRFEDVIAADVMKAIATSGKVDEERDYLSVRAPNAIEWVTKSEYLNQPTLYRHWGAYELIKNFFELRCPVCNEGGVPEDPWGLSQSALESEILLVWDKDNEDDTCPKCGTTKAEFIEDGLMRGYKILHAIIGQRGGKSTTIGYIGTYVEHVLRTIALTYDGGIQGYMGLPPGAPLAMTFVASNQDQAADTVWACYKNTRNLSPWFRRYVPWLKQQEKLQKTREDFAAGMKKWEYVENETEISDGLNYLVINALNSNSNGLAGRTRIFAAIDEISRMLQTDSQFSAQEIYRTMDASCQTVQGLVTRHGLVNWLGMICSISSPISVDDYGMKLLEVAKTDSRMYAVRKATWEFNPYMPKTAFADLLRKDLVGTMRNFGAEPPGAANPLIDRPHDFRMSAIDPSLKPTATFLPYERVDSQGREMLGVRLNQAKLILDGAPRYIAVDAGKNFDAFAVACAHGEKDTDGNIITVYDWVIRLLTRSAKQEVYFESVYQLLKDLKQYMIIKRIEFDHWQSSSIVQRIRDEMNVWAEEAETPPEHFIKFMRDAYSGYIRMLPEEAEDHLLDPPFKSPHGAAIYELMHLERDPRNDKVYNSKKGERRGWDSDDTARVCVHAHRLVQDQGYTIRQDDTSRRAKMKRSEIGMASWEARGGGHIFNPSRLVMGGMNKGGGRGW